MFRMRQTFQGINEQWQCTVCVSAQQYQFTTYILHSTRGVGTTGNECPLQQYTRQYKGFISFVSVCTKAESHALLLSLLRQYAGPAVGHCGQDLVFPSFYSTGRVSSRQGPAVVLLPIMCFGPSHPEVGIHLRSPTAWWQRLRDLGYRATLVPSRTAPRQPSLQSLSLRSVCCALKRSRLPHGRYAMAADRTQQPRTSLGGNAHVTLKVTFVSPRHCFPPRSVAITGTNGTQHRHGPLWLS